MAVLEEAERRLPQTSLPPEIGEPRPGRRVDGFEVLSADGRVLSSVDVLATPATYLFMTAGCEPCERLEAELRRERNQLGAYPLRVVVDDGSPVPSLPFFVEVLRQRHRDVSRAFGNGVAPQSIAVGADGLVLAAEVTQSVDEVRRVAAALEKGGVPEREAIFV